MRIATLIALVQLSLATAVSDEKTLTAAELNFQLSGNNALSPFYSSESDETGVTFVRGSRAADSPLSPDIDVKCSADFIEVTVEFADVFDGIIYSKGHLNDAKCKYVSIGGSQSRYSFRVPLNGCGSRPLCNACGTIDNVLVFQTDDFVQGPSDFARKVSCASTALEVSTGVKKESSHVLKLKPFMVDMLDVVAVPGPTGGIECWMDIQRGEFPKTTPLEKSIKIGEYLTILIYLRDERNKFSLKVHDCWAYDNEDYDSPQTSKIQLTDKEGCPKKKKLIDYWQTSTNTGKSGATVITYSKVSAFRFPETDQVYLTCNVELCTSDCQSNCEGNEITTTFRPEFKCYPGSNDARCGVTAPPQIVCGPDSEDSRCPKPTTLSPPRCFPGSLDPRCPSPTTPEAPRCFPGSTNPLCPSTPTPKPTPSSCYPGSKDPKCPQPFAPSSTNPPQDYLPPVGNEINSSIKGKLARKSIEDYDDPLSDAGSFEFSRTQPKKRVARDISKNANNLIDPYGAGYIYGTFVGVTVFIVFSVALSVFMYKRSRVQKQTNVQNLC
ncbi:unnamed protein product [Pieris macdunnoughi]|uniref:ZP domain-containing protein n=1 Tax=Pieris macdunnoughi TaxID=345717 RepID=A0A821RDK1_9NEOP|nr:unnamed protein product [Pieris macdunnoughi]